MASAFKQYLKSSRADSAGKLLQKAYIANRLAKICHGRSRSALYGLKCRCLSQALELTDTGSFCDSVVSYPIQLIGVTTARGYRFHVPPERLSGDALRSLRNWKRRTTNVNAA